MNYTQHYKLAQKNYPETLRGSDLKDSTLVTLPYLKESFDGPAVAPVRAIAERLDDMFQGTTYRPAGRAAKAFRHILGLPEEHMFGELSEPIDEIADLVLPHIESIWYGCHVHLFRATIQRSIVNKELGPAVSELWHHDNYPTECRKVIVFLSDCTPEHGPFEYKVGGDGWPFLIQPSKTGPGQWTKPRRRRELGLTPEQAKLRTEQITGPMGTSFIFDQNVLHRRSLPQVPGRTTLMLSIRPTIEPKRPYWHKAHSCVWEPPGGGLDPLPMDPKRVFPPPLHPEKVAQ